MTNKSRYWRVDVIHINGSHAPSIFVETEESRLWKAESQAKAKAQEKSRLSDFPQKWLFIPVLVNKILVNNKWVIPY